LNQSLGEIYGSRPQASAHQTYQLLQNFIAQHWILIHRLVSFLAIRGSSSSTRPRRSWRSSWSSPSKTARIGLAPQSS